MSKRTRGASLVLALAVGGVALAAGLAMSPPEPAPPSAAAQAPPTDLFTTEHWPPGAAAERGREVYARHCIGCHGEQGYGDGVAARWLDPLPRDFAQANFKFRSTPSGELPTREDLEHVVRCGLKGSSMPGFPLMPDGQRRDVVEYVRYLATFGMVKAEVDDLLADGDPLEEILAEELPYIEEEVLFDAFEEVWPMVVPQSPEVDEDLIAQGRELYAAQCTACHGETGVGDGDSSFHLRDWKDAQVLPRDFTTGVFRAGSSPRDLFLRLKTGLNGTPMPAVYQPDDDVWAMVHYILSMPGPDSRVAPHPISCEAHADLPQELSR